MSRRRAHPGLLVSAATARALAGMIGNEPLTRDSAWSGVVADERLNRSLLLILGVEDFLAPAMVVTPLVRKQNRTWVRHQDGVARRPMLEPHQPRGEWNQGTFWRGQGWLTRLPCGWPECDSQINVVSSLIRIHNHPQGTGGPRHNWRRRLQ